MLKKIVFHLFLFCSICLFGALFYLQTDDEIQGVITTKIISFLEKEWGARVRVKKARVNFFTMVRGED